MAQLPLPVLVGVKPPSKWDEIEAQQQEVGADASSWLLEQRRPELADRVLDWSKSGLEPRWVGSDSADCVAALQPGIFSGDGFDEFTRFVDAAKGRAETAVVISKMGFVEDPAVRNVFGPVDSIHLSGDKTTIVGRRLGHGAQVDVADDLCAADQQLALRLRSLDPAPSWWALSLEGMTFHGHDGPVGHAAQGALQPILLTALGEPAAAVWLSPDGVERRYVVPIQTPWPLLMAWLADQGLPELVPGAMRRARRHLSADPTLMTRRERRAAAKLAQLTADFADLKATVDRELEDARAAADPLRRALLYGTGDALVGGVSAVLQWAAVEVLNLDEHLGGPRNADLLCSSQGRSRLVEVKSAGGSPTERVYQDLDRHLREWPHLAASRPVEGGALIINHHYRLEPHLRPARPFTRAEFLDAQTEPVITSLSLFEAWRHDDAAAVRRLLFADIDG